MKLDNIAIVLFTCFALGLPIWTMSNNTHSSQNINSCDGECYEQWKDKTGGTLAIAEASAAAKAEASPSELGERLYAGCVACHGAAGEGGIGPKVAGQSVADIQTKLLQYKAGEKRGAQSNLMWSQAGQLSAADIDGLAAFIAEF